MTKKFKIDFYRVEIPDAGVSFEGILQQVDSLSTTDRVQEVRLHQIWLCQSSKRQQFWEGDMIRLRMSDVPVKGSLSGNVEEINLADDEGIGEQTAFLYHIPTRILALQSSQSGTSPSAFAKYFEIMGGLNQPIYLDPVLQLDAMARLLNMHSVSRFEVRVAGLDHMGVLQNQGIGVQEFISLSEAFRAPTLSLKLSVGRTKKKTLAVETIKNVAKQLTRAAQRNQQNVKTLRISGSTDEEENVQLDLLKDRMREIVDINLGRQRSIPYLLRQKAIQEGWTRRQDELTRMFTSQSA
jgi:hypothetical protein